MLHGLVKRPISVSHKQLKPLSNWKKSKICSASFCKLLFLDCFIYCMLFCSLSPPTAKYTKKRNKQHNNSLWMLNSMFRFFFVFDSFCIVRYLLHFLSYFYDQMDIDRNTIWPDGKRSNQPGSRDENTKLRTRMAAKVALFTLLAGNL